MRRILFASAIILSAPACADEPAKLDVALGGIENGAPIPAKNAYCQPDGEKKTIDGGNISPELSWSKGPEGTKSYAVIMVDPDVPAFFDDANKPDRTIAEDRPRRDFYHWVLTDISADLTRLPEGADSNEVNKSGKPAGKTRYGLRGINDFSGKHTFAGYDGPCPPWNDARLHHYHFQVYALSASTLNLKGNFTARDALVAMQGKVLAKGEATGTYTQNPDVAVKK